MSQTLKIIRDLFEPPLLHADPPECDCCKDMACVHETVECTDCGATYEMGQRHECERIKLVTCDANELRRLKRVEAKALDIVHAKASGGSGAAIEEGFVLLARALADQDE